MGREDRRGKRKSREQSRKTRIPELGYYYKYLYYMKIQYNGRFL